MQKSKEQSENIPGELQFASLFGMIYYTAAVVYIVFMAVNMLYAILMKKVLLINPLLLWDVSIGGLRPVNRLVAHLLVDSSSSIIIPVIICAAILLVLVTRIISSAHLRRCRKWAFWVCLITAVIFTALRLMNFWMTAPCWQSLIMKIEWSIMGPVFICECVTIGCLLSNRSKQFFFTGN
jgi:hypothetical protein